jgi:hypothetical protein
MTEEDIYEMISEAGMCVSNFDRFIGRVWCSEGYPIDEELFRFAALVAAREREECAKVAAAWQTDVLNPQYHCDCATAIRRRGEQ